ncbi:MAG: phosphatase PAP2 family protein, partial [Persicimonas sp.]
AGLLYSTHVPAAVLFGIYLWWRCRRDTSSDGDRRVHPFMWGYLLMNLIGFVIWVCMPVAPPWYVEKYGLSAPSGPVLGDPAALERVDLLLGYAHFQSIYEQATYVFGAFPSMHVAPGVWVALWARRPSLRVIAVLYACLMSFFAVYLTHHYIVDVLAGALLAAAVYWLMSRTRARGWSIRLAAALRRAVDGVKARGRGS